MIIYIQFIFLSISLCYDICRLHNNLINLDTAHYIRIDVDNALWIQICLIRLLRRDTNHLLRFESWTQIIICLSKKMLNTNIYIYIYFLLIENWHNSVYVYIYSFLLLFIYYLYRMLIRNIKDILIYKHKINNKLYFIWNHNAISVPLSNVTIHAHSYITEVLWIDCTQNVQFSNFWLLKKKKKEIRRYTFI